MPYLRYWNILYVLILGLALGAGLFAGMAGAPVVFNANAYIPGGTLSQYQMGSLMTELFVRLNYFLILALILVTADEFRKILQREITLFDSLVAVVMIISGALFAFYYVPEVLALQMQGPAATQTAGFSELHAASELWFKLFTVLTLVLAVRRLLSISCR